MSEDRWQQRMVPEPVEPRAVQTDELASALAQHYGLHISGPLPDLGGGMCLNLLVEHPRKLVVRVYRPWIKPARLIDIQRVRVFLADHGIPIQQPVPTNDGEAWIVVDHRLVEIEPFVEHNGKMDTWERLQAGLPMLGRIHSLLTHFTVSTAGAEAPACNSIGREVVLDQSLIGLARLRTLDLTPAERAFADQAEQFAYRIHALEQDRQGLPRQLVHGDFWDNNILLRDEQIVQIADLDFMGVRERIDDLALTLYYTNSTFEPGRDNPDRIKKLGALIEAYNAGLQEPLSEAERNALPLATARVPLTFVAQMAIADEPIVHTLVEELVPDLAWAMALLDQLDQWQRTWSRLT